MNTKRENDQTQTAGFASGKPNVSFQHFFVNLSFIARSKSRRAIKNVKKFLLFKSKSATVCFYIIQCFSCKHINLSG